MSHVIADLIEKISNLVVKQIKNNHQKAGGGGGSVFSSLAQTG
jgi:hypothetical protein